MTREETCARELFALLTDRFEDPATGTTVVIAGGNIVWIVTVARACRACEVWVIPGEHGYIISLKDGSDLTGTAITRTTPEIATLIGAWLHGDAYASLYAAFPCVESHEKVLTGLLDAIVAFAPELRTAGECCISRKSSFAYELVISVGDRKCRISSGGNPSPQPAAIFVADESGIMSLIVSEVACDDFPCMIKRWLLDGAMPSAMHHEFPALQLGPLASYYEEGRLMEGEFIDSWDDVEVTIRSWDIRSEETKIRNREFFLIWERIGKLVPLLREAGYDRCLRAGTSVSRFIVSRSRHHGLRVGQPSITFWLPEDRMDIFTDDPDVPILSLPYIELTPGVRALLDELVAKPID
jgi:hypothetical protein